MEYTKLVYLITKYAKLNLVLPAHVTLVRHRSKGSVTSKAKGEDRRETCWHGDLLHHYRLYVMLYFSCAIFYD
jgi:hypothetical protein